MCRRTSSQQPCKAGKVGITIISPIFAHGETEGRWNRRQGRERGVDAGSLAQCAQASSLCCLLGLVRRDEARPRLEEMGLSSQSHLGLAGRTITFSWEVEGQKQSCSISEDNWESVALGSKDNSIPRASNSRSRGVACWPCSKEPETADWPPGIKRGPRVPLPHPTGRLPTETGGEHSRLGETPCDRGCSCH